MARLKVDPSTKREDLAFPDFLREFLTRIASVQSIIITGEAQGTVFRLSVSKGFASLIIFHGEDPIVISDGRLIEAAFKQILREAL